MPVYPKPFRVGLILTERCDVRCTHCWFDCGPDRTATMSLYKAQDYVEKAVKAGVEWVSLTGGEPMLYPSLVENIIAYSSGNGLRTELVTNCNWAESLDKARGTLKLLMETGLDVVNLSTDDFHQAFVPFERVRSVYEAAKELGLKMVIMSAVSNGSSGLSDVAAKLGDNITPAREAGESAAIGIESGFTPVGRGGSLPRSTWQLDSEPLSGGCGSVLRDLGIRPSGEVLPCCSASAIVPGFGLGNLDDWELGEMLEKAWQMYVFRILRERGPTGIKDQSFGEYVNRCHFCSEAVSELYFSFKSL